MAVRISFATPADDAAIRGLLRREPVPGLIAISYEREPDFSIGCEATGENATVLVARDTDSGDTVGVACRSERQVYVNGERTRLGYLGQLRIDGRYQGRWLVSRGYSILRELHDRDPVPAYLAAVTAENRVAEAILVGKARKRFPAFHPVADYCTLALRIWREARSHGVFAAAYEDLPEIVRFLQTEGRRRQFFPVWSEAKLTFLTRRLGLRIEEIQIARRHGNIAGVMALWDQTGYKQSVVRSYSGWMRLAARLDSAGPGWLREPLLPKPGERIRSGYAALVCVAEDDTAVFGELLSAVSGRAASRGLEYLLLGLDTKDPFLAAARQGPHVVYRSRLFLAEWPDGGHLHALLDRRPTYVEIATL